MEEKVPATAPALRDSGDEAWPESPPSFGAEKATPLPLPCLDPSLLSLQPGLPAVAANFFDGLRF